MIYIEKKSVANIPPASGAVSDTKNVTDKVTNAPSIRLVEEMIDNIDVSGGVADAVDWENVQNKPTNVSDFTNDANYITESDVNTIVGNVIGAAPDALNTLEELANALGDDENFAATITTELSKKVNSEDIYSKEEIDDKLSNIDISESSGGIPTNSVIGYTQEGTPEGYEEVYIQSNIPVGAGMDYFGTIAPVNYLFADGSAISRTTYAKLFEIIGTTYGEGDGSTTFNLPDKRERVSISAGGEDWYPGKTGGSISHSHTQASTTGSTTLTIDQIPSHNHQSYVTGYSGWGSMSISGYVLQFSHLANQSAGSTTLANTSTSRIALSAGGSQGHTHTLGSINSAYSLPPYLVCNYIIRVR